MFSWLPTDAEVLGTNEMPFDHEEDPAPYVGRADQEASDCEMMARSTLMEEMDPEMQQSLSSQSGGLTLPPMVGSTSWTAQGIDQIHQNETSRLTIFNQDQDDWSSFPRPSIFDDNLTPMPGRSVYPGTNSTSLSFLGHTEYQNEAAVATTGSFFPSYAPGTVPPQNSTDIVCPPTPESVSPIPSTASSNTRKPSNPKRKRVLPRLTRNQPPANDGNEDEIDSLLPPTNNLAHETRVPHNQVEQKYRNGLNDNINRLREVVASTQNTADSAKLSKAMVLSGAVDCIKTMEDARHELEVENKGLRKRNRKLRKDKRRMSAAGSLGEEDVRDK